VSRSTKFRFWQLSLGLALSLVSTCSLALARDQPESYAGLELFAGNQVNRTAVERLINLKGDASAQRVAAAQTRLQKYFERSHQVANVQIVSVGEDQLALVIDLPDPLSSVVTRRLDSPRHVRLTSEKPFLLLGSIHDRLALLEQEGRPAREEWREGLRFYSDEPVNQMIEEIQKFLPSMTAELLTVVNSDPDPLKRAQAIELLAWGSEANDTAKKLLMALDDADLRVRSECTKYLYARLNLFNDNFPFPALLEGLAHMLERPSHQDRSKALFCLLKLYQLHPDLVPTGKSLTEERVAQISKESILPSIKDLAAKIQVIFAGAPSVSDSQSKGSPSEDSGL
jgi:hypothetical protein